MNNIELLKTLYAAHANLATTMCYNTDAELDEAICDIRMAVHNIIEVVESKIKEES